MPLALMFAACSTDNGNTISKADPTPGPEMGGSSEEPNIIAYENISLRGRAYYAPAAIGKEGSVENIDASLSVDVFGSGGTVMLRELDSTTLEWTDAPYYTVEYSAAVEDSMTQEIPDGAEAVPADSMATAAAAKDSSAEKAAANATVSQAVVDSAVKKSDLPASATIFISSDSKKETVAEEAPKTNKTNFVLIGSGEALSWVGLKRRENSDAFLKEANISRAGVRMVYNTNDTLCVTIGDPVAIAKMLLNGVETPLPEMKFGRVTRFRVYGGKIVK